MNNEVEILLHGLTVSKPKLLQLVHPVERTSLPLKEGMDQVRNDSRQVSTSCGLNQDFGEYL